MPVIKISDLPLAGQNLLEDSESYLNDLSDDNDVNKIVGGLNRTPPDYYPPSSCFCQPGTLL
jgi:hypothetical protein